MKNGWKNAWKWITNEKTKKNICSKKSFSKDFGLPSTKNSTWEPNLEWRVLLLLWPVFFWKSAVCQLCANTHSMFRVPDLFWLTGAVFRNISVTHSKFSKRKKSSKTWGFGPGGVHVNFSDTPSDFQMVILCFSPALYIYIYTLNIFSYWLDIIHMYIPHCLLLVYIYLYIHTFLVMMVYWKMIYIYLFIYSGHIIIFTKYVIYTYSLRFIVLTYIYIYCLVIMV